MEPSSDWLEPVWDFYGGKHRPPPNVAWDVLVEESGERGGCSYYHPDLTPDQQRELELRCVRDGELFRTERTKRLYWLDAGTVVGAE